MSTLQETSENLLSFLYKNFYSLSAVISAIQRFMLIRLGAFKTALEKSPQKTRN